MEHKNFCYVFECEGIVCVCISYKSICDAYKQMTGKVIRPYKFHNMFDYTDIVFIRKKPIEIKITKTKLI